MWQLLKILQKELFWGQNFQLVGGRGRKNCSFPERSEKCVKKNQRKEAQNRCNGNILLRFQSMAEPKLGDCCSAVCPCLAALAEIRSPGSPRHNRGSREITAFWLLPGLLSCWVLSPGHWAGEALLWKMEVVTCIPQKAPGSWGFLSSLPGCSVRALRAQDRKQRGERCRQWTSRGKKQLVLGVKGLRKHGFWFIFSTYQGLLRGWLWGRKLQPCLVYADGSIFWH